MDVGEKLVELIGSTEYGNGSLVGKNFQKGFIEKIASNLIANGVTVQEWISVKDRLPERYKYVILWDAMDRDIFMGVLDDKIEWYVPGYQDEPFHITHWMPLPQPPKGE